MHTRQGYDTKNMVAGGHYINHQPRSLHTQCTPDASPNRLCASFFSSAVHENNSFGTPLKHPPHTLMSCCQTRLRTGSAPPSSPRQCTKTTLSALHSSILRTLR